MSLDLDLSLANTSIYAPNDFIFSNLSLEEESQEYGACTFRLNCLRILFRQSKITPTKNGQFVTLWKRAQKGPIQPFDSSDPIDFYIVHTRKEDRIGQFIFPRNILVQKGVLSKEGRGGKRAMRLYPPWDLPESKQAAATQKWQIDYFCEFSQGNSVSKAAKLLQIS